MFFVCESLHHTEPWLENFLEEQTYYFVNACKEEGVEVYLELLDDEDHKIHHTTQEVIGFFDKYTPPKYLDLFTMNVSLSDKELSATMKIGKDYPDKENALIAFYLMYDGERVQVRSYLKETKVTFILEENDMDLDKIEVIGWLKNKDGKIIRKKMGI
jgi:hypothetical protein